MKPVERIKRSCDNCAISSQYVPQPTDLGNLDEMDRFSTYVMCFGSRWFHPPQHVPHMGTPPIFGSAGKFAIES